VHDEPTPRNLPERTGKHLCIRCLREVDADTYQRNDMLCEECAAIEDAQGESHEGMRDEG